MPLVSEALFLFALLQSPAVVAAEPAAFPAPVDVVVDGDLSEWERRGPLRIDTAAQLNLFEGQALSREWGGNEDASATVYVAYDEDHLYLGGEVKDDLLLTDDQIWWQGDCLELFLDTDREGDRARWTWSDDDWQICILPYASGRPWGVSMHGRKPLLSDGGLRGIEVAGRPTTGAGYTFEVRIPFANFPGLDPAAGPIGFNLAVHDHDRKPDGTQKQSYLTLNGASHNYLDTRNMLDLRFAGRVEDTSSRGGSWVDRLRDWLALLIPALVLIVLVAWTSRPLYEWVDRRLRSWRRIGAIVLATLVFVVFGAPLLVSVWLEHRVAQEFEPRAQALARVVADLGEEFARHQGRGLDAPEAVVKLLQGRAVRTRPHLVPEAFPLRADEGSVPARRSAEGIPVRPFGFEAPAQTTLAFPLPEPATLSRVYLFGESWFDDRVRPPGAPDILEEALEVGVRLADGTERVDAFPLIDRNSAAVPSDAAARVRTAWFEDGRRVDQFFVGGSALADVLVEAVLVTPRDPTVRFLVHGVTVARAETPDTLAPLPLLRTSRSGAPVALWEGAVPARAPVTVLAGAAHGAPIDRTLDALWFFFATEDPSVLDTERSGLEVARFRVRLAGGGERVVPLRSGIHVWHARFDPAKRPEGLESRIALPWSPDGAAPRWIESLEVTLSEDGEAIAVEGVTLENVGLTSIRWFACTGARQRAQVAREPGSTLLEAGRELSVRPDVVAALGDLGFVVFAGGSVAAADVGDPELSASLLGLRYPLGGDEEAAAQADRHSATLFGERYLVRNIPVHGGDGELTIAAVARVEGEATLQRARRKAAFVSILLIIPLLLFYVIDFATGIARLRLRLTTLLVATSLLPIVFLFTVLYGVVSSDRARLRETRAGAALGQVQARVAELLRQTQRAAREVVRSDVVREVAAGGALEAERIERYLTEVRELQASPALDVALRLEVEADDGRRVRFHDAPGRESASRFDLVEGGVRGHWGRLVFVSTEERPGSTVAVRVTAAAEATHEFRSALEEALGAGVAILTLDGYPLAGGGGGDPAPRVSDIEKVREQNRPATRRDPAGRLVATDLLRAPGEDAPFGVAEVTLPDDPSLLEVSFLRLPLDTFFFWFCTLALGAAVFVATVATRRITGPVEALEGAARRVADGQLDVAVPAGDAGEVGRLAVSFNVMTERLRERSRERARLDRATVRLAGSIELEATAAVGLDALTEEPRCAAGAVYLLAPGASAAERVACVGDRSSFEESLHRTSPLLERGEASVLPGDADGRPGRGDTGGNVVLPLRAAGRSTGVVVLCPAPAVARAELELALPLLKNLSGQLAVALENARLYRLAVVDPETGVYVRSYAESRLAEEIDRSQDAGERVSVVRVRLAKATSAARAAAEVGALATAIREACREMHLVGRRSDGFLVILPRAGTVEAQAFLDRLAQKLRRHDGSEADGLRGLARRVSAAAASFPEDGESRAFLLDAAERRLSASRRTDLEKALDAADDSVTATADLGPYVFRAPLVMELLRSLARVATSRVSVLLLGETGVGKEVFADLLHRWSDRGNRPFVAINCSAVPEPLLEAELFGHERGAFTGADRERPGRLEEADGGTVFLDEIGDMPASIQAKLLRVLQDGRIVRLGSNVPVEVDIRVVAATNRDLGALIERGEFRQDLYFRLKVVSFEIPPLRDRKEDIPVLVEQCVRRFGEESGAPAPTVSPAALDALHRYDWPGNVRELINVVRRALLFSEEGVVRADDLEFDAIDSRGAEEIPTASRVSAPRPRALATADEPNERQKRLLQRLAPGETIRSRDYFELVGVSPRTGLRDLNDLLARGLLVRLGRRRAATYRLAGADEGR